ncbi:unnamed protein product, partial [Closterium sp. Naga37s-1]
KNGHLSRLHRHRASFSDPAHALHWARPISHGSDECCAVPMQLPGLLAGLVLGVTFMVITVMPL